MARLGDYVEQIRGVSYKPEDVCSSEDINAIPILRANNIQDDGLVFDDLVYVKKNKISAIQYVKAGDIVVCASSGSKNLVGKAAISSEDMPVSFGAFCKVVRPTKLLPSYVGHYFRSPKYRQKISELAAGANINNIRNEHIDELDIVIVSEEEQERIVKELDALNYLISLRKQQLSKLDELVKSQFIELFGEPESNPYGHPIKKLSDIASYWNGLTYKPEDVQNQGTIVLRSSNIQNSQLDFEDTVRVACRIREKQYVQNNDILMCSRNGSAKLVGKVALITNIAEPMSFGAFMMIIRSDYYRYLMTYFQMDAFRNQIKTGATTTINQITGNMLNQVTLPVPDLNVVSQFETFVEQTDKSKFEIQKSLEKLETLKKALMQKYFG